MWLVLLLVVAARPAAAYTVSSPAALYKSSLEGAQVVLRTGHAGAGFGEDYWGSNYN